MTKWQEELLDKEMGLIYSKKESIFRVYSPVRKDISLRIYNDYNDILYEEYEMTKNEDGCFEKILKEDLNGKYYTYVLDGLEEVTDPYSISSSMNSTKSAIVNLEETNPEGWEDHNIADIKRSEAIIYELHIKDFTYSENSGVKYPGKYLGLAEKGTRYKGYTTGLDHLKELGVTHIHLMPIYDFLTVKEEESLFNEDDNYNWGYDPELYNVPEGSYSLDSTDPKSRIYELKTLIKEIHEQGMKVVLDVVYNHVYRSWNSNFHKLYPNYYLRMKEDGSFSDGGGVGSEMASEKPMFRKFILESINYWQKEYKVDGFRFDLMGLIDIDTMKEVVNTARKNDPDVLIYGEPWTCRDTTLPYEKRTLKGSQRNNGFACFNDTFRDSIKGDNNGSVLGFAMGDFNKKLIVETGIAGSIDLDNNHIGFTNSPEETINYVNSHDDMILYDKIESSLKNASDEDKESIYKLCNSIIFMSFGIPFIHEGNEFLRSKNGISNTYNKPISINKVDWSLKEKNYDTFIFFKELINLRKELKFFSEFNRIDIKNNLKFLDLKHKPSIAYYVTYEDNIYLFVHNAKDRPLELIKSNLCDIMTSKIGDKLENTRKILKIFNKNGKVNEDVSELDNVIIDKFSTEVYKIY